MENHWQKFDKYFYISPYRKLPAHIFREIMGGVSFKSLLLWAVRNGYLDQKMLPPKLHAVNTSYPHNQYYKTYFGLDLKDEWKFLIYHDQHHVIKVNTDALDQLNEVQEFDGHFFSLDSTINSPL